MLEASQIECVRGSRRLFGNLSFQIGARQALRIRGENGSGKTSLLRMIAGLSPCESGRITWQGKSIAEDAQEYRRVLLFIGHANALQDDLNASENLRHLLALAGLSVSGEKLATALDGQGLHEVAQLPARMLSQGQKRRVALAGLTFCSGRSLWILDEPFAALDGRSVSRVAAVIAAHVRDGGCACFTTHQEVELPGLAVAVVDIGIG
ncbi:MAG: cytochrome c biogenesis heme-transporting ATPase CcmA [Burkholderiales bacterium]